MMKWLRLLILTLTLTLLLLPSSVSASTSADVTVTATGYVCGAPGGLTLTYTSDYEVGISWTKGEGAVNTMVRAAVGRAPESRTDGYLVYYGDGTNTTDWSNNLDTLDAAVYYKAWSEKAGGVWEEGGSATEFVAGIGMILLVIGIVCLGLMIAGFVLKQAMLLLAAGLGWIMFGFLMYSKVFENAFMNEALLTLGLALALVSFVSTLTIYMRSRPPKISPEEADYQNYRRKVLEATRRR